MMQSQLLIFGSTELNTGTTNHSMETFDTKNFGFKNGIRPALTVLGLVLDVDM